MRKNRKNWICPKCGKSYYTDSGGTITAMHFQPIWKDGVNINPDRNILSFTRTCLACKAAFQIRGNEVDGYETKKEI